MKSQSSSVWATASVLYLVIFGTFAIIAPLAHYIHGELDEKNGLPMSVSKFKLSLSRKKCQIRNSSEINFVISYFIWQVVSLYLQIVTIVFLLSVDAYFIHGQKKIGQVSIQTLCARKSKLLTKYRRKRWHFYTNLQWRFM